MKFHSFKVTSSLSCLVFNSANCCSMDWDIVTFFNMMHRTELWRDHESIGHLYQIFCYQLLNIYTSASLPFEGLCLWCVTFLPVAHFFPLMLGLLVVILCSPSVSEGVDPSTRSSSWFSATHWKSILLAWWSVARWSSCSSHWLSSHFQAVAAPRSLGSWFH